MNEEEKRVPFIYSKVKTEKKPSTEYIRKTLQYRRNYVMTNCTIEEMFNAICDGRSWRPSDYNFTPPFSHPDEEWSFRGEFVKGVRFLALDLDSSQYGPDEIIQYAENIGLRPNFYYWTYSQGIKSGNNFRIVWVLDETLTPQQYKIVAPILIEKFKKFDPDKAPKDAARLWFGTMNGGEIFNKEFTKITDISWLSIIHDLEKGKTYSAAKRKKTNAAVYYEDIPVPDSVVVGADWIDDLKYRCDLWDRWVDGEYLEYPQRITLWANLKYIKRNQKSIIEEIWAYYNAAEYHLSPLSERTEEDYFKEMIGVFKGKMRPQPIVKNEGRYETIPEFFSKEKREPNYTFEKETTLEILDEMMKREIPRLLESPGLTYVKSQTASGKTEHIIDWLTTLDLEDYKVIYAAPTYIVLKEFEGRFNEVWNSKFPSKESPINVIPEGEYEEWNLQRLYIGASSQSRLNVDRKKAIVKMMDKKTTSGLWVISHQLVSQLQIKSDLIIIDENIEEVLINPIDITFKQILGLVSGFEDKKSVDSILRLYSWLLDTKYGQVVSLSSYKKLLRQNLTKKEKEKGNKPKFDIMKYINQTDNPAPGLFQMMSGKNKTARVAQYGGEPSLRVVNRSSLVSYAIKNNIPVKFFTATPKDEILFIYYRDIPLEYFEFPIAANRGQVVQFRGITGARGNRNSAVPKIVDFALANIPKQEQENAYVLGFKGSEKLWEDAGFKIFREQDGTVLHLGNNAGIDVLKGKIVIVGGKYDMNEEYYMNVFYDIYPPETPRPLRRKQTLDIGGRRQTLFLWDNELLRDIQIGKIRQAVQQAAGRARALREVAAKVYILADFIIEEVDILI